jgi:hypothetical protein
LVLGEYGKLCGWKIADIRYRITVTVERMFKVVREMTEAATNLFPVSPRVHAGQGSGHGLSGLDTPRAGRTDPVIGSASDRFLKVKLLIFIE